MSRILRRPPRGLLNALAEHAGVGLVVVAVGVAVDPFLGIGLYGGWLVLWANR
jgi:hypothetical protein